ncbi:4-coumarate--CoA ligase-like 7 [Pseudomyrmex gracilis]|uniref:4-coumarate--CoA ligase-like 7 n=1 Tax=Pseudomyrmex gracilis TaxID=219809 RepID=UPI000994A5DD|nr:4-coumarate--CoA ligase-like 7 [Pseudomyrmex gracilis]
MTTRLSIGLWKVKHMIDSNENYSNFWQESRDFTVENNVYKGPVVYNTNVYKNLGHMIWDKLNSYGDTIARIDAQTEETITYKELQVKTVKCALWLKQQGIGRDDVVSICCPSHMNSIVPCLSATYVAAIFNGMDEDMDLPTALHCIKLIKPKAIFCTAKPLNVIRTAVTEANYNIKVVVFDDNSDEFSFSDILNGYTDAEIANFRYVEHDILKQTACIVHSSGTINMPKGVELSNSTLMNLAINKTINMKNSVSFWFTSLYWITGVSLNLRAIAHGANVLLYPVFDEEMTCVIIEKYKVNILYLSTSMMTRFLKAGYIKNYSLPSLRSIINGGAILKSSVQEDLKNLLPHVNILQSYGMTEFGGSITLQKPYHKSGSSGVVIDNVQLKIVDSDTGKVLGPNQSGEIWVKSPNMIIRYYNNPEETKRTIDEDGWFHTGDIGYVDVDGELFILDRIKDIIKYKMYPLSPSEIEAVLSRHPAVREVAVVGVPHDLDTTHPLAFVTKKPDAKVTEEDLINYVANNMTDYYKLRAGVIFLDKFPYTGSGKISKKEVNAMAKKLTVNGQVKQT